MQPKEIVSKYITDEEQLEMLVVPAHVGIFNRYDWLLVPVTAVISIFLIGSVVVPFFAGHAKGIGFFSLFGILFVLIAFYLLVGRLWYRYRKAKRDIYAVTDRRILIIHTLGEQTMEELERRQVQPRLRGHNIALAPGNVARDLYFGLGLDLFFRFHVVPTPEMVGLADPQAVMECLRGQAD